MRSSTNQRRGFTLVELLVVIAIIATLAALLTPAVMIAIHRAKLATIKLEVTKIEQGLESYKNKHTDYPPDFSDAATVKRHFRKAFPKLAPEEISLLNYITDPDEVTIDRAEALFLALHGYSADPTHPLSGPGGPLAGTTFNSSGQLQALGGSQGMTDSFIEFDETKIKWALSGTTYSSTDGDGDPFPTYVQSGTETPFVYFDSRTYVYNDPDDGWKVNSFQDLNNSLAGIAQPYKSAQPTPKPNSNEASGVWEPLPDGTEPQALKFAVAEKFQIITAGPDGKFSALGVPEQPAEARVHPTGTNYKTEDNDNITNFAGTTLEGDLP